MAYNAVFIHSCKNSIGKEKYNDDYFEKRKYNPRNNTAIIWQTFVRPLENILQTKR